MTVSRLHCRTARALLSLLSGKRGVPSRAGVPKPRRQGLPPRTGHPIRCRVARADHQLSLLGVTRCSARRFCKEHCAAQEMEVWNLPEPHLSSLPSPLPPDRTVPFSAPLPPKGLGLEHTWELGGGYDTVPLWTAVCTTTISSSGIPVRKLLRFPALAQPRRTMSPGITTI